MSKKIIEKLLNGDLPTDFNWNTDDHPSILRLAMAPMEPTAKQAGDITIVSEDLRDCLHGIPEYPSVESMTTYVSLLYKLGIRNFTVGIYPGEANRIDT